MDAAEADERMMNELARKMTGGSCMTCDSVLLSVTQPLVVFRPTCTMIPRFAAEQVVYPREELDIDPIALHLSCGDNLSTPSGFKVRQGGALEWRIRQRGERKHVKRSSGLIGDVEVLMKVVDEIVRLPV